ncbi:hypothetical protein LSAT2_007262 [Lamellibrachia satsuma]|nr:hypothetical protein LSAT2_007262 [Lamellibrachia satsuma]
MVTAKGQSCVLMCLRSSPNLNLDLQIVYNRVDVDALAVDTDTGKLYFSQDNAVNSVNGFGSDRKRIFTPAGQNPKINGIAVDPDRR